MVDALPLEVGNIYNPWSILIIWIKESWTYWANSSSNRLQGVIREGSREVKQTLKGCCPKIPAVNWMNRLCYNQLMAKRNSIWSLLLAALFKDRGCGACERQDEHIIHALTNKEVAYV